MQARLNTRIGAGGHDITDQHLLAHFQQANNPQEKKNACVLAAPHAGQASADLHEHQ
jgi:hypothetical protein